MLNQITIEDLFSNTLIENKEGMLKEEKQGVKKENLLKDKDIYVENIHISTYKVINEYLKEIRMSTLTNEFNRRASIENFKRRYDAYTELYDKYYSEVTDADKEVFSKIVNYITAEGASRETYSEPSGNIPMKLEYRAVFKNKELSEVYKRDDYYTNETTLIHEASNNIFKYFYGEEEALGEYYKKMEKVKIEFTSSYDIEFDLNDLDILQDQAAKLINSNHFKNWKFKGKRTEDEMEILSYLFSAKHEAMSHKNRGTKIYKNINIDTCRYLSCLILFTKVGKYSTYSDRVSSLEEKINLYNKIYPYYLEEIDEDNREFFAKAANYLTFENEKYSISGYSDFANTSKEAVLNRVKLLATIDALCKNKPVPKPKKNQEIELWSNHLQFMFSFRGGAGKWDTTEDDKRRYKIMDELFNNEVFNNWEFEGLKTEKENEKVLEYIDVFKEINFSEESYYILGIALNEIHKEKTLEDRKSKKERILKSIQSHIPVNDRNTFDILMNYYTNEDEYGFNIKPHLIDLNADVKLKSNGVIVGRLRLRNTNKYSQVTNQQIVNSIDNFYQYLDDVKDMNEDNVYDKVDVYYRIKPLNIPASNISPDMYFNKSYILECFKEILNDSLETEAVLDNSLLESNKSEVSTEESNIEDISLGNTKFEVEKNTDTEFENMFDLLNIIEEQSNNKKIMDGQLAFSI